jgi:hypothetical protein
MFTRAKKKPKDPFEGKTIISNPDGKHFEVNGAWVIPIGPNRSARRAVNATRARVGLPKVQSPYKGTKRGQTS